MAIPQLWTLTLSPILRRYIDRVEAEIETSKTCRLMFMQSNGGLTDASLFQGKDAILSGPAGGVVGMVETSRAAGFDKVIGFDMGGTSTDVSHYNGDYERAFDTEVAGVRMRAPMMSIHTVAAGGGSILSYDGARMRVGPDSAGADPGPTAYRKGGPLTVTDANLLLGKLQPDLFPCVFGPNADQSLDRDAVGQAFEALAQRIGKPPEEVADGFLKIAVENMAQAVKKISVARGYDITQYALACFGGAGAQHACLVADALNMKTVIIHPFASLLSAYGMGLADIRAHREQSVEAELSDQALRNLDAVRATLRTDAVSEVTRQNVTPEHIHEQIHLHLRYQGTDTALMVEDGSLEDITNAFNTLHAQRFGFRGTDAPLIIEAISVEAIGRGEPLRTEKANGDIEVKPASIAKTVKIFSKDQWVPAHVVMREEMVPGQFAEGPALIIDPHSTIVVEPEWRAQMKADTNLILTRRIAAKREAAIGTQVDPVMLEIFNNLFMSIAEQMGFTLEKTATSVNIKERLDFSCALFDKDGGLVANAPHMPVHLGSMGASVRTIIEQNRDMAPGDVFALNAPYNGGTHLPDVTVIAPVFDDAEEQVLFYVAARGHHADIGGITPGSMPAASRTVEEEGVLIDNFVLVRHGAFREEAVLNLLKNTAYPARNPEQNIADLKAQIAACEKGAQELRAMVSQFGLDVVNAYMGHVQDNVEECVRRVIDVLHDSNFTVPMDGGETICVAIRIDKQARRATIDFTGTSDASPTNFNAPSAVTRAAVLYVFRAMVKDTIPLNEGCLKPLDIIIPHGCLLNPRYPAAVVAGNVETSQYITDALFGALGVMAAAQGTMNNLTFGNDRYQYYETICGGSGAGATFHGTSAVHTHMTNSRLTDVEVLEWRYPVLVDSFEIRRGSGGSGSCRGGDGVIRRLRFLEEMEASILSTRRKTEPFGLQGGAPGAPGRNTIKRESGTVTLLDGCDTSTLQPGDTIVIETPGGGGFGKTGK